MGLSITLLWSIKDEEHTLSSSEKQAKADPLGTTWVITIVFYYSIDQGT